MLSNKQLQSLQLVIDRIRDVQIECDDERDYAAMDELIYPIQDIIDKASEAKGVHS